MSKILLFSLSECSYCDKAKAWLTENNHAFQVVHVERDTPLLQFCKNTSNSSTFPQIFIDNQYFGGYDDLLEKPFPFVSKYKLLEIEAPEPLTVETTQNSRLILFPIPSNMLDVYKAYEKALESFWVVGELDLTQDIACYNEVLNANERHFINCVLAFFASSDAIVMENLSANFSSDFKDPVIRLWYASQELIEAIHNQVYNVLIDTYILDKEEKLKFFHAIQTMPIIKEKVLWGQKYMNSATNSLAERIAAFVVVEGVLFSSSFAAIFWLKKRQLMNGLCQSNLLISRDENFHATVGVMLYQKLTHRLAEEDIHAIFREAVEIERVFLTESLPVSLIGMNDEMMLAYVKYVADYWLVELGYKKIFNVSNPLSFMEMQGIEIKENFFENKVTNYALARSATNTADTTFSMDEDF
jgi:ribonucleoside-diphosphate reductase beta chain